MIGIQINIKLLCLYLVQHMLHQIKAQQFYTNFLVLISPLSQSSISEVEFLLLNQDFSYTFSP